MMDKLKKLLQRCIPVLSAEEIIAIAEDMDIFGSTDPAKMPEHMFYRAVERDWSTAVRANVDNQNYSVCPRHWYVDAVIPCEGCGEEFTFSAEEQRLWYETYHFYVDSFPQRCLQCRRSDRRIKSLRQDYDRLIAAALASVRRRGASRKSLAAHAPQVNLRRIHSATASDAESVIEFWTPRQFVVVPIYCSQDWQLECCDDFINESADCREVRDDHRWRRSVSRSPRRGCCP